MPKGYGRPFNRRVKSAPPVEGDESTLPGGYGRIAALHNRQRMTGERSRNLNEVQRLKRKRKASTAAGAIKTTKPNADPRMPARSPVD